jgi:phytoene dehydrogenase-like protein
VKEKQKIIIIGAGLAGLACATRLHEAGHQVTIFEASDGPGGRVRTDELDGFLLDRGFQVYLSAYPETGKLLNFETLKLQKFRAGALVRTGGKFHRVMDVFRHPQSTITSALAPIGSLRDKLLVAMMRFQTKRASINQLATREDISTEQRLKNFGFSARMIDRFFRGFYGGIFLERDLRTSSRMFDFTFKMFAEGHATVPARGMQAIPNQLVEKLPRKSIRYRSPVASVTEQSITLENGEVHQADHIVIATDATTATQFLPGSPECEPRWRATATLYFSAPKTPLNEEIIALDGDGTSLINNVCVISDVAPHYAPPGRALVSVSVLGSAQRPDLETAVQDELENWFGAQAASWQLLRTYRIEKALPEQLPGTTATIAPRGRIHVCGDHQTSSSIEGAVVSGLNVARAICK